MSIKYVNVVLAAALAGIVLALAHLAHEGARLEHRIEQLTRDLGPTLDPRGATVVITSYYTADGHLAGRRVDRPQATYRQTLADVLAAGGGESGVTVTNADGTLYLQGGAALTDRGGSAGHVTLSTCGCACAACQAGHK